MVHHFGAWEVQASAERQLDQMRDGPVAMEEDGLLAACLAGPRRWSPGSQIV